MSVLAGNRCSLKGVLARGITTLAQQGESPHGDAMLLLSHVIGRERPWIVAHGDASLSRRQAERFLTLCEQRGAGIPIAYLLGSVEFYGREFLVNANVMVPRPETEHLVEEALAYLRERERSHPASTAAVLDVGVGSGAIACTIAAENPCVFVDATDTSSAAIEVAERNARRLGVVKRCRFHHASFATPVKDRIFDAIVANLPYVPTSDVPAPPEPAGFEPRVALDGGHDGLAAYRAFLPATPYLLAAGGLLLLEGAPPVMPGLGALVARTFPGVRLEIGKDYAGLERYVKLVASRVSEVRQAAAAK
jgi:release factor glutamine methyltransferase